MALPPGSRFGAYEVTAQIGAGGMGEVYRARDTKLDRDVALKILPDSFARDPERLERFRREAKTLAALNHPNISHLYGLEGQAASDAPFLVMELVEGEDLSKRIARGAVPLDEALPIARQIADALEAAHEQGIVHRDLKPANIKLRPDGAVKVLDFGLAKLAEAGEAGRESLSHLPTIATPAMPFDFRSGHHEQGRVVTEAGLILGTAAYMSPEQARGTTVDKRADLWAFGVVLWEMLTGKRLFEGATVSDTLASVLKTDPEWNTLAPATPPAIHRLLRRCLEKDRRRRLDSAAAARLEIEEALAAPSAVQDSPAQRGSMPRPTTSRALTWTLAAATLALAIALVLSTTWRAQTPVDRPLVRLDVDLGDAVAFPPPTSGGSSVAISPDGTRLAYASGTPSKLFVRRLDQPTATELAGTQGASRPFFSPDGQWVGFHARSKLNKISVEGGAVVPLLDVGNAYGGASWGEDGSILVRPGGADRGVVRISADGGQPQTVATPDDGEIALAIPQALPGGKAILLVGVKARDVDRQTIEVLTLSDQHSEVLVTGGNSPRYLPTSARTGHLVYVNRATLFAIPFDPDRLETRGSAVAVLDDVAYDPDFGVGHYDVSRTGTMVYRRAGGGGSALWTLQWVDASGNREPLLTTPGRYRFPRLSQDGRVALVATEGGLQNVFAYDQQGRRTRLSSGAEARNPVWSPDGQHVVFGIRANGGIFQNRADGAGQPEALTKSTAYQTPFSFSTDGKRLAYIEETGTVTQIWTISLEDQGGQLKAGKPERFIESSFADRAPSFSPDGRWLAYQSNKSGTEQVYVRSFPPPSSGPGEEWTISNGVGMEPRWLSNGGSLVYRSGQQIMAAGYTVKEAKFVAEPPRVWIASLGGAQAQWDLAPDGKRVAVLTRVQSAEAPKQEHTVVFLQNFFDELRRRVPGP